MQAANFTVQLSTVDCKSGLKLTISLVSIRLGLRKTNNCSYVYIISLCTETVFLEPQTVCCFYRLRKLSIL